MELPLKHPFTNAAGQRIEKLYDTEARKRGAVCVDIGAVYRDPQELACFPGQAPTPEYTWKGWGAAMSAASAAAPDTPPPAVFGLLRAVPE